MYKALPLIAALLTLTACATPQERCISSARSEQNGITRQINKIETNIARGYAIHEQTVPYTFIATCLDEASVEYSCEKNGTRIEETPVTIDIAEERRKLIPLQRRLASIRASTAADVAQCRSEFAS